MPFWTKEKGDRGLGFQGKGRKVSDRRERTNVINACSLGHPETMGRRGKSNNQLLLDCSLSATFSLYYNAKAMFPSFKQAFLPEFF